MSLLAPWFLLGALAIAGPILFHLIRQAVRERMPFSSLMFLRPTPPRITRRRKLEHPWLLLLRCLCLVLLATGFARPFFSNNNRLPPTPSEERRVVLLVDTSASMRRDGVWDQARAVAEKYLATATPVDQFAILTFDRQPHTLVSFDEWSAWPSGQRAALARERLNAVSPGWFGTQLGLALTTAAEQFTEDPPNGKAASQRELVLISDLQEGARLDGLQGHDWPAGVRAVVERITANQKTNAGLGIADNTVGRDLNDSNVVVRVINARDSDREKFRLNWIAANGDAVGESVEVYVPPGQSRSVPAPRTTAGQALTQMRLTGDAQAFDNLAYYAAPDPERVTIACFGPASANDPATLRYYYQRVFPTSTRREIHFISPVTNSVFVPELLNDAAFALIPTNLTVGEASAVHAWLARGRAALLVLTDTQMSSTLATLADLPGVDLTEATGDYALLGDIDFTHPIFAPFADPRFSDFTHIHFWRHRRWEIPATARARVLARFDDESPALVQWPVGQGTLLVLASGWQPVDSQLAVSSKFPPLMQTMLDWGGATRTRRFQFQTGDVIPPPMASTNLAEWTTPEGTKIPLAGNLSFGHTDLPGIYTVNFSGKQFRFAVNLPPDESRTAPILTDELARLGVPLQSAVASVSADQLRQRERRLQRAELEQRQQLWRWLIAAVLAITFGEIILGGWLARRVKTIEVAA